MLRTLTLCLAVLSAGPASAQESCRIPASTDLEAQPPIRTSPANPWLAVKGDQPVDSLPDPATLGNSFGRTNVFPRDLKGPCDPAHDHCLRDCTWLVFWKMFAGAPQSMTRAKIGVQSAHVRLGKFVMPRAITGSFDTDGDFEAYRTVPAVKRLLRPGVKVMVPDRVLETDAPAVLQKEHEALSWTMGTLLEFDWEKGTLTFARSPGALPLASARIVVLVYKKDGKVELANGFTRDEIVVKPEELFQPVAGPADDGVIKRSSLVKVPPAPGAPVIAKVRPTWCDRVDADSVQPNDLGRQISRPYDTVRYAVKAMCAAPDDAVFQEQVGAYYQAWANETGLDAPALTEYFAALSNEAQWEKQHEETCATIEVPDEASEREKTLGEMRKAVLGCGIGKQTSAPRHLQAMATGIGTADLWHFDRQLAVPSQLAAVFRVLNCTFSEDDTLFPIVQYASCAADARQLDEKALHAELEAAKLNDYARITARQALGVAKYRASRKEVALTAFVKKEPEARAVLVDVPERAMKEWNDLYLANKRAIDLAWAFEDTFHGTDRSRAKGCLAQAQANADGFFKSLKGTTVDAILESATSPMGAIVLEHLRSCNEAEGRPEAAAILEQAIQWGLPRRGPRFFAALAMSDAVAKVLERRPKFVLTGELVGSLWSGAPITLGQKNVIFAPQYSGTVANVAVQGGKATVTFKKETWQEDEVFCTETRRIIMFERDGTPIYARNCKGTGKKVTRSSTAEPFWVWAPLAAGIKPGTFVRYSTTMPMLGRVFGGIPVEVKSSPKSTTVLATMGLVAH